MDHIITIEVNASTAKRMLQQLDAAERLPIKFSWVDASEWHQALKDALEVDDG